MSSRVLTLLKQASAEASETATADQALHHSHQTKDQRPEFELDVTEEPPTSDQFRSILDYVGAHRAKDLVEGATDASDAIRRLSEHGGAFKRPVVSKPL